MEFKQKKRVRWNGLLCYPPAGRALSELPESPPWEHQVRKGACWAALRNWKPFPHHPLFRQQEVVLYYLHLPL